MASDEPKLPAVRSIAWLDGWRDIGTTLSNEKKKRDRPQEDFDDKKQFANEKQNWPNSVGKQPDSPLVLQPLTKPDRIGDDGDKARGREKR